MREKLSVLLFGIALLLSSCGNQNAGEKVQSADAAVNAPAADPKMMIVARLSIKPENADAFIEAAKDIIEKSNAEAGCTYYQLFRDPYDVSKFIFVEEYTNQAAVDFHFSTEYFNSFGPKIADFLIGTPEIKIVTVAAEVIR